MNTKEQTAITEEELEEFKKHLDKFIKTCNKEKVDCVKTTKANMETDVAALQGMLATLENKETYPDELTMLLHNIIAIVPEEQHRFLDNIQRLYAELPSYIRVHSDVSYAQNRLLQYKISDLDTKVQTTDISRYWVEYRRLLYKYGICDNHVQKRIQVRMREKMLRIANKTIEKRTRGIKSAEVILRNFENQPK